MRFSPALRDGFSWSKDGLTKASCPWVSPEAIAAFNRGYDLAADFATWAEAKRYLILAAENNIDITDPP